MAATASAGLVSYSTTGVFSCPVGLVGCSASTNTVSIGGLTLTYTGGSGTNVNDVPFSTINIGNIMSAGTGSGVNMTGIALIISILSTPPGTTQTLPSGTLNGSLSTANSQTSITFAPNNVTTFLGTLPGTVFTSGSTSIAYQVQTPMLGIQAPTVGSPAGQTSIQGYVLDISAPEPATFVLMGAGLGLFGLLRRRRS